MTIGVGSTSLSGYSRPGNVVLSGDMKTVIRPHPEEVVLRTYGRNASGSRYLFNPYS
jgi:hypothetical protein